MMMKKIILDRNENNYGPAPACLDVLKKADKSLLFPYTDAYKRGVKSSLSERFSSDFDIEEDRIILGYGAEDILKQLVQCYLAPGSKLMIPSYSWWYYKAIASEVGGTNIEYPLLKGKDSFYYDIESMLSLIKNERPALVFLSSPNNPTGNSIFDEDLAKVLDNLRDTTVALDEAYWAKGNNQRVTDLVEKYDNLIVIRTFSKLFALAGVRIGYALIGKNLRAFYNMANRYLGYNLLSEQIALAALDSHEYYDDLNIKMESDKEIYYNELGSLPGFTVYRSDANFVLVEIPAEIKDTLKNYLKERDIIIKFMNEEVLNSHLRITIGTQAENRTVIDTIKNFINQ
jgi:histidinol-phosphate aminotransferase